MGGTGYSVDGNVAARETVGGVSMSPEVAPAGATLLAALRDQERAAALDRLSHLAAMLLHAPIAHVTLIVADRQHYCGRYGFPEELVTEEGTVLTMGFCPSVVASGEALLVSDLTDSPFRDNPAVVDYGARAYAGTPLRLADGSVLGTLCVLDFEARSWPDETIQVLTQLAASVVTELELVEALDEAAQALAEREQALELARAEQARAERLLEHAPAVVAVVDAADLRLTYANRAFLELGACADAVGRTLHELLPAAGAGDYLPVFERVRETGEPIVRAEQPLLAPAGTPAASMRHVTFAVVPVHGAEDGEVRELLLHAVDVSDQVRRAGAARVIERIGEGVVLLDADGIVLLWNPAAAALTAIAEDEARGRPIRELLPGWDEGLTGGSILAVDTDEGERRLAITGVPAEDGSVHALRDVTDEHRLARMRDELIATISHQLRTPLASIYAAAVTLRRSDIELDERVGEQLLEIVEQQAQLLTALSDEILLASRLDAGTQHASIEPVPLSPLVADVVEGMSSQHAAADGPFLLDLDDDTTAAADRAALRQVLMNLLDNAVKYSPAGGTVRISTGPAGEGQVELVVEDEGGGIPLQERARIFEKFYRLDPHMASGVGGTGLGLYICRELARRMDGDVEVGDADGDGGARFRVILPAA